MIKKLANEEPQSDHEKASHVCNKDDQGMHRQRWNLEHVVRLESPRGEKV
jgi:hypothetical protein